MVKKLWFFPLVLLVFSNCREPDCPDEDDDPDAVIYDPKPVTLNTQGLPPVEIPVDNPLTEQGVKLGRMLFYEPMLSGNNTLACAGCHNQSTAFADARRFSTGIDGVNGVRNSMALFNLAYPRSFFWDGRARTLEEQILEPVPNPIEMHEDWQDAVSELQASSVYPKQYYRAFGDSAITKELTAKAIAQFLRTLISNNSRYDQHLRGELFGTSREWTESEERGFELFFTEFGNPNGGADCFHCHGNILFQEVDPTLQFRNNGLQHAATLNDFVDKGRGAVTNNPQDNGKFKVPSLRNVQFSAPYMHDGRFKTLEEVVDFYSDSLQQSPNVDPLMKGVQSGGVHLTPDQKQDLINFLKALSDESIRTNTNFSSPF